MVHHCSDEKDCKVAPQHAGVGAVDTDDFWKLMAIGRALYEARDFEAAKLNFHKAVDIVHDSQIPGHSRTKAVNNLSACLLQLGDHNGVLQCAQDVLKVRLLTRKGVRVGVISLDNCRLPHYHTAVPICPGVFF